MPNPVNEAVREKVARAIQGAYDGSSRWPWEAADAAIAVIEAERDVCQTCAPMQCDCDDGPVSGSAAQNHEWGVPAGSQDAPTMGATNILPDPPVFQARSPQDEDHEAREGVEFQEEIGPAARQRSGPGTQEGRS